MYLVMRFIRTEREVDDNIMRPKVRVNIAVRVREEREWAALQTQRIVLVS